MRDGIRRRDYRRDSQASGSQDHGRDQAKDRAGMGRCQSGFCSPKVMEILAREWNMDLLEVRKASDESWMLKGRDKEEL